VDELELDDIRGLGGPPRRARLHRAADHLARARLEVVIYGVAPQLDAPGVSMRIAERMGAVIVERPEEPGASSTTSRWASLTTASSPLEGTPVEGPTRCQLAIGPRLTLVGGCSVYASRKR